MSAGNAGIEIPLNDNHLTLVIGKNGNGKSSFIEAIVFALYGKPFRNISKPQLINSINQKQCLTQIDFSINSTEYKVVRGMKPTVFEIYRDGVLLNQDSNARDYQKVLEEQILGINYKVFTQVIILGSASFTPFMQLPASSRREVIEDILDINIFSTMNSILKDKILVSKDALNQIDNHYKLTRERVIAQKKLVDTLKSANHEHETSVNEKILVLNGDVQKLNELITDCNNQIIDLNKIIKTFDGVDSKVKETQRHIWRKNSELNTHEKLHEFINDHDSCPTCTQNITDNFRDAKKVQLDTEIELIKQDLDILKVELEKHNTRKEQLDKLLVKLSDIEGKLKIHEYAMNTTSKTIASLQDELKLPKNNISEENETLLSLTNDALSLSDDKANVLKTRAIQDYAQQLLKDTGIKTSIIREYLPIMNKLINNYLHVMDSFVTFNLDENFNEVIASRHRDKFSYSSFSEGEKARINIAILFCWRHIAKMKNSASTNLLIMDEIMDSAMDGEGMNSVMQLLQSIDSNVFVISHRGEMVDKFDNIIEFEKQQNFSIINATN